MSCHQPFFKGSPAVLFISDQYGWSLKHDLSQIQLSCWSIAARDLQPSILVIILSSPSNELQLPINTGLAYNAMFRVLDECQRADICWNNRAKTRSTHKTSTGNHHLPVQPDMNKSQPASIELPNGASNVDGKSWMSNVDERMAGVEHQWKKVVLR